MSQLMEGPTIFGRLSGRLPAVTVVYGLAGQKPAMTVGSGWYVEDDGDLFVVLAAHWWQDVLALAEAGARTKVRLIDGMSKTCPSIPLGAVVDVPIVPIQSEEFGVDLALLHLQGLLAEAVRANSDFVPFKRETILLAGAEPAPKMEGVSYVVGYPEHDARYDDGGVRVKPSALGVLGEHERNSLCAQVGSSHEVRDDWYYLRIGHQEDLPEGFTVKGMSGGPVLCVTETEVLVAGIQTLWWPRLAVVGVQPVDRLVHILDLWHEKKPKGPVP